MQFTLSDERLEQIELEVVESNYEKIKYAEEKRKFLCIFVSFLVWEIIFLTILFSFKPTTGDNDMLILLCSLIGSIISFIIGEQIAKRISRKKFTAMARDYLETKKDLMLERILVDYEVDDNLSFFRNLYEDNLIDSEKKTQIDSFLAQENKTQREFLTKYGEPLFDDNFEAFKFGPAISVVYYEYSHMGAFKIGADYKDYNKILSGMSQDEVALLDSVIVSNMETNPLELLNKINKAWKKVFNNGEGVGDIISKEAMCERSWSDKMKTKLQAEQAKLDKLKASLSNN